ncbi:topoisomerase DNA-binding C4 zinc finger domain-containing protein [Candidatus Latescibacterota bacterium]
MVTKSGLYTLCLTFLMFALLSTTVLGHSGGTDSSGGHYNRQTGEYHYHHGMGPHQHPGGVCPYKAGGTIVIPVVILAVFGYIIWTSFSSKKPGNNRSVYTRKSIFPVVKQDDKPKGPSCPTCGSEMVLRMARKGRFAGKQFWGCRKYPNCRGIKNIKEKIDNIDRDM